MVGMKGIATFFVLLACVPLVAQDGPKQRRKRAMALARQLELPARRYEVGAELWRLGPDAVPALARNLADPRPEVVAISLGVLRWFPASGDAAIMARLEELTQSDNDLVAVAAFECLGAQRLGDHNLCIDFNRNKVVRWSKNGTGDDEFEDAHSLPGSPYDAEVLPDGRVLATLGKRLVVYAGFGKNLAFEVKTNHVIDVDGMPGDRFLVADRKEHKVAVLDKDGAELWAYRQDGMLAVESGRQWNGSILVCDHRTEADGGGVHVVDGATSKQIRMVPCNQPCDAELLADGAVVAVLSKPKSVVIYERDNSVRATLGLPMKPSDVDILPDGTMIVAGGTRILHVDRQLRIIGDTTGMKYICGVQFVAGGPLPRPVEREEGR